MRSDRPWWDFLIFSGTALLTATLGLAAVHLGLKRDETVPRPALPDLTEAYIATYGGHSADHYLFHHGSFGFGQRIRNADILLVGNSHPELGFSAEAISDQLSRRLGRPITVFNMGLPHGEGYDFAWRTIRANELRCSLLVIELYHILAPKNLTSIGAEAVRVNSVAAAFRVLDIWLHFAKDWLLDPMIQRLEVSSPTGWAMSRYLKGSVIFRRWQTGDVWELWLAARGGSIYRTTPEGLVSFAKPGQDPYAGPLSTPHAFLRASDLQAQALQALTTLVPYVNYEPEKAKSDSAQIGLPFIDLDPTGITLYDGVHANRDGRSVVTQRLIDGLVAALEDGVARLPDCRSP